jgi:hypothetical protein
MLKKLLFLSPFIVLLSSCWGFGNRTEFKEKVSGYKPIYSTDPSVLNIALEGPRAVKNAGKIFAIGNFIFQNEIGEGIHVIDRTNPSHLVNKGFIIIKGNTEVAVKGNFMYANSFNDLVVIDFSNWQVPKEIKRMKNVIALNSFAYQSYIPLPQKGVYAVCPDPTKGTHIGWEKDTVSLLDCYFYNP